MPRPAARRLPAQWTRHRLGEVASRVTTRNRVGDTNALTISAKDGLISQVEYFSRRVAGDDLRQYFLLQRGDFAYNKSYSAGYPVGVIRRLDRYETGVVSPLYICFRPDVGQYSDFLRHYFSAGCIDDQIAWVAKEGIRNHGLLNVGVNDLFSLEIDLPPLEEQRRIAEILDSVDESIRATECLVLKLRQIRNGLLRDLLRDPAGRTASARTDWQQLPLGQVADVAGGVALGRVLSGGGTVELPYLRVANVLDGYIDTTDVKSVSVLRSEVSRYELLPGDFLMTEGGDFDKLGRGAVWDGSIQPCLHQNHIFRVRTDRSRLLPQFLAAYAASHEARRYFVTASKQTTNLATINMTQVRAFPVPVPPVSEQQRIINVLQSHDERIQASAEGVTKLVRIKQGLAEDLLSGHVRVDDARDVRGQRR